MAKHKAGMDGRKGKRDAKLTILHRRRFEHDHRALYQLNLVKVEDAYQFVPKDLPIVNLFGYTVGGLYLARYDHSPAGNMDEMVVLAGLVWDPPVSCAWASHVFVNKRSARDHGVESCGLPSRLASFGEQIKRSGKTLKKKLPWWTHKAGESFVVGVQDVGISIHSEGKEKARICSLSLPPVPANKAPAVPLQMALPSFSGRTKIRPQLLKYALDLKAKVRFVKPAKIEPGDVQGLEQGDRAHALKRILSGRPVLAMSFDNMEMEVGDPTPVQPRSRGTKEVATPPTTSSEEILVAV